VQGAEAAREISLGSKKRSPDRHRDFEMFNSLDNKNPEIAICDFAI
jgi:hypothetical protein